MLRLILRRRCLGRDIRVELLLCNCLLDLCDRRSKQVVPLDFDTEAGLWFLPTTTSPKPQANDVSRKSNEDRNRPGKNIRRMLSFYLCHTGIIHAIEMFRGEEIYTKRKYIVMTLKKSIVFVKCSLFLD